jgi:hypothetical protein
VLSSICRSASHLAGLELFGNCVDALHVHLRLVGALGELLRAAHLGFLKLREAVIV